MAKKRIGAVAFGLYCALMLWLLFNRTGYAEGTPYVDQLKFNLIPFDTIRRFLYVLRHSTNPNDLRHAVVNLAGNVIMFVPLGLGLPGLWERLRAFWKTLLLSAGIILAAEIAQLLTLLGSCDTDDLLLNLLGVSTGYLLFRLIFRKKPIA